MLLLFSRTLLSDSLTLTQQYANRGSNISGTQCSVLEFCMLKMLNASQLY